MKRLTIVGLLMGCAEPKTDVDADYEEEPGATEATALDEDSDEDQVDDSAAADAGSSDDGGGSDEGEEATGGDGSDDQEDQGDGDAGEVGDDGGEEDLPSGGGDVSDAGGGYTCLADNLDISLQVIDGDGACSSPCDSDDELSYAMTVQNTALFDCVIGTSTTCLIENVEISVAGPHGGVTETYVPMCGEAVTEHALAAGSITEETLTGGLLGPGNYVAIVNIEMPGATAFGSTSFSVE